MALIVPHILLVLPISPNIPRAYLIMFEPFLFSIDWMLFITGDHFHLIQWVCLLNPRICHVLARYPIH